MGYTLLLGVFVQNTFDLVAIVLSVLFGFALLCAVLYRWERAKKIKYGFIVIAFFCGCGVMSHTYKQSVIQAKILEFQNAFYNNETLVCMHNGTEIHVHKTTFVYFKDLLTFYGKDSMKGVNVPLMSCLQHISTQDSDFIND